MGFGLIYLAKHTCLGLCTGLFSLQQSLQASYPGPAPLWADPISPSLPGLSMNLSSLMWPSPPSRYPDCLFSLFPLASCLELDSQETVWLVVRAQHMILDGGPVSCRKHPSVLPFYLLHVNSQDKVVTSARRVPHVRGCPLLFSQDLGCTAITTFTLLYWNFLFILTLLILHLLKLECKLFEGRKSITYSYIYIFIPVSWIWKGLSKFWWTFEAMSHLVLKWLRISGGDSDNTGHSDVCIGPHWNTENRPYSVELTLTLIHWLIASFQMRFLGLLPLAYFDLLWLIFYIFPFGVLSFL